MGSAVPPQQWDEVEAFLVAEAARDLQPASWGGPPDAVRPCLVAFSGDQLVLVAWWRWFDKGQYMDPMIEVMAAVCPLGADRVALSLSGRAWSMDDPIPPVVDGIGDLRQRVLHLVLVDDHGSRGHRTEVLRPYDVEGGRVRWGERHELGPSQGQLPLGLEHLVRTREHLSASDEDIALQLRRCSALGHLVSLAPAITERFGVDLAPGPSNRRPPRSSLRATRRRSRSSRR